MLRESLTSIGAELENEQKSALEKLAQLSSAVPPLQSSPLEKFAQLSSTASPLQSVVRTLSQGFPASTATGATSPADASQAVQQFTRH